jgi:hypothetical protein
MTARDERVINSKLNKNDYDNTQGLFRFSPQSFHSKSLVMAASAALEHTNGNGVSKVPKHAHPRPSALAHVVLRTTAENYPNIVKFYKDLLQADIILEKPTFVLLRYDFEHHRVAIVQIPGTTAKQPNVLNPGIEHMAFTYATLTDLAKTYRSLKQMKSSIVPVWSVNHGMTTSMYYQDPDGNKVELQVDNFDTPEEAESFMRGPLFTENPIGTDFDPDDWASEILAKMRDDGSEGLSAEEVRQYKMRTEIGVRGEIPLIV